MTGLQSLNAERSIVIQKTARPILLACLLFQMILSLPYHTFARDRSDDAAVQNRSDQVFTQDQTAHTFAQDPSDQSFTQEQSAYTFEEHHMGTLFKITLYAESDSVAELAATNAFLEIDRLNTIMSDYLDESELNRFSRMSGTGSFIRLSDPLFEVLRQAQWISYQTNGLFDVTVGSMSKAWRVLRANPDPAHPDSEELERLKNRVGYQHLVLRHDNQSAMLEKPGMSLDLGGIAKGYASDRALETLEIFGATSALVDAGGDITLGNPPSGRTAWTIAVPKPAATAGELELLSLQGGNVTIATSGSLFQYVEIDGKRYSHVLNPKTGLGSTDQIQATVISHSAAEADALASALTLMDPEAGLKLIEQLPDTEALIFKQENGSVKEWVSSGAGNYLVD